jgi:hypothetical protein
MDSKLKVKANTIGIIAIMLSSLLIFPIVSANTENLRISISKNDIRWFSIKVNGFADISININWTDPTDSIEIEIYDGNQNFIAANRTAYLNLISLSVPKSSPMQEENVSLKVIGNGINSAPQMFIDIDCNYDLEIGAIDKIQAVISQNHMLWYELIEINSSYPMELKLNWNDINTKLNVTAYNLIKSELSESEVTINNTANSTTYLFKTLGEFAMPRWIRINGTQIANGSTIFWGISNFRLNLVPNTIIEKVEVKPGIALDYKLTIQNSTFPAEVRIFWQNSQDKVNISIFNKTFYNNFGSTWASTHYNSSPGLDVCQVKIEGIEINSAPTILIDIESNFPLQFLSHFITSTISQNQENWFMVTVEDIQVSFDLTLKWASGTDDLDIVLYTPYQLEEQVNIVKTPTSKAISKYLMFAETYYLKIIGKNITSQTTITFNITCNTKINSLARYTLNGQVQASKPTWLVMESSGDMTEFLSIVLTWNASSNSELMMNLYGPYGTLEASSIVTGNGVAKLFHDFFFPGLYNIEILLVKGIEVTVNFKLESNKLISIEAESTIITGITPLRGGNAGTVQITIMGDHLPVNATVKLQRTGYVDVLGRDIVLINPKNLVSYFDLGGIEPGNWNVVITLANGSSFTSPSTFEVVQGGSAQTWGSITGREGIRLNSDCTYTVSVGNSGDIDTYDVLVAVLVPKNITLKANAPKIPFNNSAFWQNDSANLVDTPKYWVYPMWIYCLGAHSVVSMDFVLNTNHKVEDGEKLDIFLYIQEGGDNRFAKTGNLKYFNDSINIGYWLYEMWNGMVARGDLQGPVPKPIIYNDNQTSPLAAKTFEEWLIILQGFLASHGLKVIAQAFKTLACHELITYAVGAQLFSVGVFISEVAVFFLLVSIGLFIAEYLKPYGRQFGHWVGQWICKWIYGQTAMDPNEKEGPKDSIKGNFINPKDPLMYTIYAENLKNASLPAQIVNITDVISPHLNLSTVKLQELRISNKTLKFPKGISEYNGIMDLRPNINVLVQINISIDPLTRILQIYLKGLNTTTRMLDENGFLIPNVNAPEGEVIFKFSINVANNVPSGTNITNEASIIFDGNKPIITNTWWNIVDSVAPTTTATLKANFFKPTELTLIFIGSDGSGSGIIAYHIYMLKENGKYELYLINTENNSIIINGEIGNKYSFRVFAQDAVGNYEQVIISNEGTKTPSYIGLILIAIGCIVALAGIALIIRKQSIKKKSNPVENQGKPDQPIE